jgi:hypothetical protein
MVFRFISKILFSGKAIMAVEVLPVYFLIVVKSYVVIFSLQLIITVIAKIAMPEKTTNGPGKGKLKLNMLHRRTPENPATAPKTALSQEYLRI